MVTRQWDELAAGDREEGGGVVAAADKGGGEGGLQRLWGSRRKGVGFVQGRLRRDEDGIGCACMEGIGQILVHVRAAYPANTRDKRAHQSYRLDNQGRFMEGPMQPERLGGGRLLPPRLRRQRTRVNALEPPLRRLSDEQVACRVEHPTHGS
ncbi:hypothetical protein ACQJBY_009340 [Aegilops geniculata]